MAIINHVLCPIDFSDFSRHALVRTLAIAGQHGATVSAIHVVRTPLPVFASGLDVNAPILPMLTAEDRQTLLTSLTEFVAGLPQNKVPIALDVVEAPTIAGEILAQARHLHADLIVMGTHGRSGFQRFVFGSVTERVMRTAEQPVMTVGLPGTRDQNGAFERILCAIDFSDCSAAALRYAISLADGARAKVKVVNVVEWLPMGYDPLVGPTDLAGYYQSVERAEREQLQRVVTGFATEGVLVEETIRSGKPYREILELAGEFAADLIVLGMHGKNPVERMLFGSTAEPVVRRATCPVLTVRAETIADAAAA
jgi:nucleotide-binding universal stress UspA family protein